MDAPSLKHALSHWLGFPKVGRSFEPRRTQGAVVRLEKLFGALEPRIPEPYDLEILYQRIAESWDRHHTLEHVAPRDLRRLPWVLFYPPPKEDRTGQDNAAGWLGAQADVVAEYGRWLFGNRRSLSVLALLHEFLRVYPAFLPTFDDLRELLYSIVVESVSSSSVPSLQRWRQRCVEFGLLASEGAQSFVRKRVLGGDKLPDDVLQQAGFDAGLARCGFLKTGVRAYLPQVDVSDSDPLGRFLAVLECEGKLRFEERSFRVEIATVLLRPFVDRDPEPKVKEQLQPFFLRLFGHPRPPSGLTGWYGVSEDFRNVVMRWLVKEAIDKFFQLVKETACDSHWRYRNSFWREFFDAGMISDAYFVLGRSATKLSKLQMTQDSTETTEGITGLLQGANSNQSVLLLRMSGIPGVTIAEWSHDGACRIWLDGNPNAPRLYEPTYRRHVLMSEADLSQPHARSEQGYWQRKIKQWLRDNTGIEIARNDFS